MAHELTIENGAASMIYLGETPWHELGTKLEVPPATGRDALIAANCDDDIALRPMYFHADFGGKQVPKARAIYRVRDGRHFGIVGPGWHVVQPRDAVSIIDPLLANGGAVIETAGSLRGGARIFLLAKLKLADSVIVGKADDRVAKYILIAVGNDGVLAIWIVYTPVRVVCANTLAVALGTGESNKIRIPHWGNALDKLAEVQKLLVEWDARFERAAEAFRALAAVQVKGEAQLREYVDRVVYPAKAKTLAEQAAEAAAEGKTIFAGLLDKDYTTSTGGVLNPDEGGATKETRSRIFAEIQHLFTDGKGNKEPGVAGTAWAAYNAMTEWMSWKRGKSANNRMESVWLDGGASDITRRALPAALQTFVQQ